MAESKDENDAETLLASPSRSPGRRVSGRKLAVTIHGTIGLVLGAIFVVIGLSGSILAFRQPLDEWLNADIMRVIVPEDGAYRPLEELLTAARAAALPDGVPERLSLPRTSGLAAAVTFVVTTDDLETDLYQIFVDPYTAKVTGQRLLLHGDRPFSKPFIHIVRDFHWTLLLGPNRAYIVGFTAIFLFVSVLVGAWLGWPRNRSWRKATRINWHAPLGRVSYDIHKALGLYLFAVVMVVLFTGCAMIFKPQTRSVVGLISPLRQDARDVKSTPTLAQPPLGLDAVAGIANTVFPDGKLHRILLPAGPTSVFVVGKQADDEPNRTGTNRTVTIDQFSGQILHVQDRNDFTAGERFLEWLYPLHCGEAFGNIGRMFVLTMGFVPLILFVTGFVRWRQRRPAR
jgi:uncharacterized iron-regulated membrane protein